jgi:hypothetical protein
MRPSGVAVGQLRSAVEVPIDTERGDEVPSASCTQLFFPAFASKPASHATQARLFVAVPSTYPWPAGQLATVAWVVQVAALVAAENVPVPQAWQARSAVAVGAVLTLWPATQLVRALHSRSAVAEGAFDWYCDEVQAVSAVHSRLDVAVGAFDWYCDEVQAVSAVQTRSAVEDGAPVWYSVDLQDLGVAHLD